MSQPPGRFIVSAIDVTTIRLAQAPRIDRVNGQRHNLVIRLGMVLYDERPLSREEGWHRHSVVGSFFFGRMGGRLITG